MTAYRTLQGLADALVANGLTPEQATTISEQRLATWPFGRALDILTADATFLEHGLAPETLIAWSEQQIATRQYARGLTNAHPYPLADIVTAIDDGIPGWIVMVGSETGLPIPDAIALASAVKDDTDWMRHLAPLLADGTLTGDDLTFMGELTPSMVVGRSRSGIHLGAALGNAHTAVARHAILLGAIHDGDVAVGIDLAQRIENHPGPDIVLRLILDGRTYTDAIKSADVLMRTPEEQAAIDKHRAAEDAAAEAHADARRRMTVARYHATAPTTYGHTP